ncbi:MAG: ABC transporter permease [Desertimonas sp.]
MPWRAILAAPLLALLVWYLLIAETAADNDVLGGVRQLGRGLARVPGLVFQRAAYTDWWTFMREDPRGFDGAWGTMWEHATIVLTSMAAATVISILLGIVGHRVPAVGTIATSIASVGLTIPSLALFAILMTVVGTGNTAPIIALTLYSILPILRNTLTGIAGVDRAVVEAAKGVGMPPLRRLFRIEFPLAWPVILTGIRVATLLNIGIAAIATLVGGGGLGGYINDALNIWGRPEGYYLMWAAVIFTVLLALIADLCFALLRALTTSKGLRK